MKTLFLNTPRTPSEDSLFFYGLVLKAPLEGIEEIKKSLLSRPDTQLIFQHRDVVYLAIVRASDPEAKKILEKADKRGDKP